jgi:hypothetical protein
VGRELTETKREESNTEEAVDEVYGPEKDASVASCRSSTYCVRAGVSVKDGEVNKNSDSHTFLHGRTWNGSISPNPVWVESHR